jgi:hypothetical protein
MSPRRVRESGSHAAHEMKMRISLARLGEGGAARLKMLNRNHHSAISGIIERPPRKRSMLRLESRE